MMVSPVLHPDGTVTTENTLALQDWFEPIIWIFMVMPLFFVAGGITGLQSWRRLRARGGTGLEFAQARLLRLIRPAAALLAVMFAGLWAARLFGVEPQVVELIVTGAGMPLWFLAAYLAAQLNIPLLAALHDRAPWLTLAGLTALVVAVDCFRGGPAAAGLRQHGLPVVRRPAAGIHPRRRPRRAGPVRSALVGIIVASNLLLGLVTGLGLYRGNMLVNLNPPNLLPAAPWRGPGRGAAALPAGPRRCGRGKVGPGGGRAGRTAGHDRLPVAPAAAGGHVRAAPAHRLPQTGGGDRRHGGGRGRWSCSASSCSCCRCWPPSGGWRNGRRRPPTPAAGPPPRW